MASLVLDEQLSGKGLTQALRGRGLTVHTLAEIGATGRPDPDVIRRVGQQVSSQWVLVTMDLSILEEYSGFEWERYAIGWLALPKGVRGQKAEAAKQEIVHRHAHLIAAQRPGDHFTYSRTRHDKHPPSLASLMRDL